jgi:hypothetical protein
MAVRCEGDSRIMEQLGEKQDFESELSRLGFAHEDFMLYVRRENALGSSTNWIANYAVCVTNTIARRQNVYWGGPGKHWVSEFVADVASGHFGMPNLKSALAHPPRNAARPHIVTGRAKRP